MCNLSIIRLAREKFPESFAHAQTVDTKPLFPPMWPGYEASHELAPHWVLRITTTCNLSIIGLVCEKFPESFVHAQTVDTNPLFPPTWPGYEASHELAPHWVHSSIRKLIPGRHCCFVIVGPQVVVYRLSSSQVDSYTNTRSNRHLHKKYQNFLELLMGRNYASLTLSYSSERFMQKSHAQTVDTMVKTYSCGYPRDRFHVESRVAGCNQMHLRW